MACNQRGMVLVSVLLILAVLLTLAHILAEKIWHSTRQAGAADGRAQLFWATQSGIETARQSLASSYAESRGWRTYLNPGTAPAYPDTPTWICTVNGISVEIFLRDNHDGDDDSRIDNDLKIFVLSRATGPDGTAAMLESLCGFDPPIAGGTSASGQAAAIVPVDLSAQPVNSYDIAD
jgi:Tfp pilus assembly protein PilX